MARIAAACSVVVLVAAALGLNAMAYLHVRTMLHFTHSDGPTRTPPPERLRWHEKARVLPLGVSLPRPVHRRTPGGAGLRLETQRFTTADVVALDAWWGAPR